MESFVLRVLAKFSPITASVFVVLFRYDLIHASIYFIIDLIINF